MKIHIFTTECNYNYSLLKLLEKNINIDEHLFVFRRKKSGKYEYGDYLDSRILFIENFSKLIRELLPKLKRSEQIYFHYLPYGPSLFLWYFTPKLLKKSTWIIWGGDVYIYQNKWKSLRTFTYEMLRRKIIKQFPRIAAFVKGDFEIVCRIYKTKAVYQPILYPIPIDFQLLSSLKKDYKPSGKKRILLGNSADPSNAHLEIIHYLGAHKDKDFEIICPLSYNGSQEYIENVIKMGQNIFGNRFIPLLSPIAPNDYTNILLSIDVAIMNHKRQQGLGNILPVLFLEKKVYLRSDITSFSFFKKLGCKVYDTLMLKNDTFDTLFEADSIGFKNNAIIIQKLVSEQNCSQLWKNLIE